MESYKIQIIETAVLLISYIIVHYITKTFINNSLKNTHLQRGRRKITIKIVHLFSFITALVFLSVIWGLKQNQVAIFVSTILTALGIAFFAQWSLLSNITSSLILFFNHPMKIGDTIKVFDKDFQFEGEVLDLNFFFIHIKAANGELITMPNSLVLQKAVSVTEKKEL